MIQLLKAYVKAYFHKILFYSKIKDAHFVNKIIFKIVLSLFKRVFDIIFFIDPPQVAQSVVESCGRLL